MSATLIITVGILFLISFVLGGFVTYYIMQKYNLDPLIKEQFALIDTLHASNMDNMKLISNKKQTDELLKIKFSVLTDEQANNFFKNAIHKNSIEDEQAERAFLINELRKLKATSWDINDSLEDLRNLYNLMR